MKRIATALLSLLLLALPLSGVAEDAGCTVWVPYWDCEAGVQEAVRVFDKLDAVVAFGAIFDADDQLLMLPDAEETVLSLQNEFMGKKPVYLSVVNDVQLDEGKYDNKTPALLWRLLGDDETMDAHIGALIDLAVSYGVDGIEIDYEAIRQDTALWERYALFLEKLYEAATEQGLLLRSVLSWDATKYAALPAGPQYTVMCYNLYGYHSGPGPKADQTFLATTYQLCLSLPGQARMAYATGGFDWTEGVNPKALTQAQAEQLVAQLGQTPSRDAQSGALTLTYQKDGQTHALWYADGQTLAIWRGWARECGYEGFDLFRMGGNNLDDWLATLWK